MSKLLAKGMPLDQIKSLVNSNDKIEVVFTQGIMEEGHQSLPKELDFKKGISKIYNHNNSFILVDVKDVLPKSPKTFEEAKGVVISDYQNYKEENWVKQLSEKYPIKVNEEALNKVRKQIKK